MSTGPIDPLGSLSSKHLTTLAAIFERPTRANLAWRDIESLFVAMGGVVAEGAGSRVKVRLGDVVAVFHRPHPRPEAGKATVCSVREFLANLEIEP